MLTSAVNSMGSSGDPDDVQHVPVSTSRRSLHWQAFLIAVLLLTTATAFRVYHLDRRSLWYDEAVTADASRGSLGEMLEKTRLYSAPLVHPMLLYGVERFARDVAAVRMPSVVASLLAILLMFGMERAGVDRMACLFAATLMALSATQIRYAQEVREYSLSVFAAALLLYLYLRREATGSKNTGQPWGVYAVLALCPLVQYGLVFFAAAVLAGAFVQRLSGRDAGFRLLYVVFGAVSLGFGCLLTYVLTLHWQMHGTGRQWYLVQDYFDPKQSGLLHFIVTRSADLLRFLFPGRPADALLVICFLVLCIVSVRRHTFPPAVLITLFSVFFTAMAAVLRLYPYGGVRQCLFLAPGIALSGGIAVVDTVCLVRPPAARRVVTAMLFLFLAVTLIHSTRRMDPYAEYEDTQSVLRVLDARQLPADQVWVHHNAAPAVSFYRPSPGPAFFYGIYHPDSDLYAADFASFVKPSTPRVWLIFSHLQEASDVAERDYVLAALRPNWDLRRIAAPTNTELWLATRKHS